MTTTASEYASKPSRYYSGARRSFVDILPVHHDGRLLEIGCGNGDTGAYALSSRKCGVAVGVELCQPPAVEAATKLNDVIVGDIETLVMPYPDDHFDVLIMSEVVEHLRNPSAVLERLWRLLKPNAIVISGSPNVSHHTVVSMLLRGRWDYQSTGIMDATHLRWFTPATYRRLFEEAGYVVESVSPAFALGRKARFLNSLTAGRYEYLFHSQIRLVARRPSEQRASARRE